MFHNVFDIQYSVTKLTKLYRTDHVVLYPGSRSAWEWG